MSPVVKKVRLDGTTLTSDNASAATADAKIYFNQDMDSDTLRNITVTSDGGETVGANIAYDSSDYSCTLQFTDTLSAETKYTINVPASVKTTDGRALAREYNGVFTTGEGVMYISDPVISKNGDVVTAKVTGVNQTGASGKYMLILACYDGNKLISVKYDPKSYTASDKTLNSELTYTVPSTATSFSAQAMLWDGFEKMIPIKPAAELQ